jgi:hypothetical protein
MSSGGMHCLVWGLPVAVRYRVSAPLSEFTDSSFARMSIIMYACLKGSPVHYYPIVTSLQIQTYFHHELKNIPTEQQRGRGAHSTQLRSLIRNKH